jgi:predicted PurR-regulated permease PerM
MKEEKILDLSWNSILKIILLVIFFYILFQVKDIVVWFIFALVISILFNPAIDFLGKFKVPRTIATSVVYLSMFGILSLLLYSIVVILITEIDQLSKVLPYYFQEVSPFFRDVGINVFQDLESFIDKTKDSLRELSGAFFAVSFSFFGGIMTSFFVLTMAFFMSLEGRTVERAMILIFPKKHENFAFTLWRKCQRQVSSWFFTRVLSCLFVGIVSYIACLALAIKYPLSLGLIAGGMNFIPYVGPLVSGVLVFAVTAMDGIGKAIFILVIFAIIQTIEGFVITPILSQKFIGLSPVLVITALAVGGALWGFLGALLAIPLAGILFEFLKEFLEKKKKSEQEDYC